MKTDEKNFLNREPAEPTAGLNSAAIPLWLTGLLAVLLYWSCTFTDTRGGHFSPLVYAPYTSTHQLAEYLPSSGDDGLFKQGKMVFNKNCAPCHQESGSGNHRGDGRPHSVFRQQLIPPVRVRQSMGDSAGVLGRALLRGRTKRVDGPRRQPPRWRRTGGTRVSRRD